MDSGGACLSSAFLGEGVCCLCLVPAGLRALRPLAPYLLLQCLPCQPSLHWHLLGSVQVPYSPQPGSQTAVTEWAHVGLGDVVPPCSQQHAAGLGIDRGPHREGMGAAHPATAAAAPAWTLAGRSKPRGPAGPCHCGWDRTPAQHHAHRRPAECSCQVLMLQRPGVSLSVSLGTSVIATLTRCWFIGAQNADQTAGGAFVKTCLVS